MKVSDYAKAKPFLKIAGYGKNGTGKTTDAARAPMPLFISREEQSVPAILAVNPDAHYVQVGDARSLFHVVKALKRAGPVLLDNGQPALSMKLDGETIVFQTLVPDSITELQELLKAHIIGRREADFDGAPGSFDDQMTQRDWGKFQGLFGALMRDLRGLDCNLYALFLEAVKSDDEGRILEMRPWADGSIGRNIGRYFAGIGYFDKRGNKEAVTYGISWERPNPRVTKRPPGWPYYTVNDINVPGMVTLGSLALHTFGNEAHVPHAEGDSPEHVSAVLQRIAAENMEDD